MSKREATLRQKKDELEALLVNQNPNYIPVKERLPWLMKRIFVWIANRHLKNHLPHDQTVMQMMSDITGMSRQSISNHLKSVPSNLTPSTSGGNKKNSYESEEFDEEDLTQLRRIIYSLHGQMKHPKSRHIIEQFRGKRRTPDWTVNCKTLSRVIKSIGFRYGKTKFGKPAIAESPRIRELRDQFLTKYFWYVENGYNMYFEDESWIHTSDIKSGYSWSDGSPECIHPCFEPTKGPLLIIAHVGSKDGFVKGPNGEDLSFVMNTHKPDPGYKKNMNAENFEHWMINIILPRVPRKSVLVMDNCSYHKRIPNKKPTSRHNKAGLINYIIDNDFGNLLPEFLMSLTKLQLLQIIDSINIPQNIALYQPFKDKGVELLFLPPYHSEFNPVELVWSQVKPRVKQHNVEQNEAMCRQKIKEAFMYCDQFWGNWVRKCEDEMRKRMELEYGDEESLLNEHVDVTGEEEIAL